MSRQSLDMRYGRQGGRIVPWKHTAECDTEPVLITKHCTGCGRMMQHVGDFEPLCSDCRDQPSLFGAES